MIFNGKTYAREIKDSLRAEFLALPQKPQFHIIYAGSDPSIESFMKIKTRVGDEVGVTTIIHHFPDAVSQKELILAIQKIANDPNVDGMIIQLPLPKGMNTDEILNAVPPEKDVDVLSEKAFTLFSEERVPNIPPVARAMMDILHKNKIPLRGKQVVVLGRGRLVGKPMKVCLLREGAIITGLNSTTGDPTPYLLKADVIISGVGKAHLIKPEMINDGVVIIDGGTSEKDGKIAGDADPACAEKCALFTPVPGGVGPVMVTMLFQNLAELIRLHRHG